MDRGKVRGQCREREEGKEQTRRRYDGGDLDGRKGEAGMW